MKNKNIDLLIQYFQICKFLKENTSEVFFFFPFWQTGGGEKVHADILGVFADKKPICFLTQVSRNNAFQKEFEKNSRVLLLGKWAMKSNLKRVIFKKIAKKINALESPIVFGCNSTFFYKLLPRLSSHVKVFDLIHAFSEHGTEKYSIPFVSRIDKRVVLGEKTFGDFKKLYEDHNISKDYLKRIQIINNKVQIPKKNVNRLNKSVLKILFVARNAPEKRFELFLSIAVMCLEQGIKAEFIVIGDFENYSMDISINVTLVGELNDRKSINYWYEKCDLLLVTSSREGFPMTIMEGMSYGVVPITTSVGEIPSVLNATFCKNAIVINNSNDAGHIVREFVKAIKGFAEEKTLLLDYSENAYRFAKNNFGQDVFCRKYRALFEI